MFFPSFPFLQSFSSAEKAVELYCSRTFCHFRKTKTVRLDEAYREGGRFPYVYCQFTCIHYGVRKARGRGVRPNQVGICDEGGLGMVVVFFMFLYGRSSGRAAG